jgi:gluconolactonase
MRQRSGIGYPLRPWRYSCAPAADDSICFTDPGYGIFGNYEGHKADSEQPPRVYRVDGKSGKATIVTDTFDKPNGLAFSPDEKRLYIIDTGLTHGGRSNMRVFDVDIGTGKVTNDKVFAENFAAGFTDGVRTDIDGNVWCSMGWADPKEDGVRCYAPSGDLIGKIHLPETCANLAFAARSEIARRPSAGWPSLTLPRLSMTC